MSDFEPSEGSVIPCPQCKSHMPIPHSTAPCWIEIGLVEKRIRATLQCPSCHHRFEMEWYPDGKMSFCPANGLDRLKASLGIRPYDFWCWVEDQFSWYAQHVKSKSMERGSPKRWSPWCAAITIRVNRRIAENKPSVLHTVHILPESFGRLNLSI